MQIRIPAALAVVALCLSLGQAAEPAGDEWRSLFDGNNLNAWTSVGLAKWRVKDGIIIGGQDGDPRRGGMLVTKDQFKDFELLLDFMIDEHGKYNSGVYLRNAPESRGRTGYQVNIGRAAAEEYAGGIFTDRWLDKGDEDDSVRKKLDWNTLRIVAKGGHVTVDLNGVTVSNYSDPTPTERLLRAGTIALQTYGAEGHAGWVKFRNIRIREIADER